jgi:hypothetical protein
MHTLAVMAVVVAQLMFPPKWTPSEPGKPTVVAPAPVNPIVPLPVVGAETAPAVPAPPAVPGETVAADEEDDAPGLVFNWPEGIDVKVESMRTKEQTGTRESKPVAIRSSYRMRVYPHADGFVVRTEDFTLPDAPPANDPSGLEALIGMLAPSIVVNGAGEFVRIEDTKAVKQFLSDMFAPVLKDKGTNVPAGIMQVMQQMSSDEFLNAIAASEWNSLIGAWAEFPIEDGLFEDTMEEPNPMMPDLTIPMKLKLTSGDVQECERGGAKYRCAVFEMTSNVDQAAFEPMMKRMFEGVKELQGAKYEQFDLLTTVRVKLETDTMLPHDYQMTKTVNMKMSLPNAPNPITMKQVDKRTSRFTY